MIVVLLTVGAFLPESALPGWDDVFVATGLSPSSTTADGEMEVHFLDVGNADCILIRQGESAALIDAGEKGDREKIVRYLQTHGVDRLEWVVSTHPHADHIGGMAAVLESFPVDNFLLQFPPEKVTPTSSLYLEMLELLEGKQISVTEAQRGDRYSIGQATLQVVGPTEEINDLNALSLVIRLEYGKRSFLLTADTVAESEEDMLFSNAYLYADVLKVAHHGSNTSSSSAFLEAVSPQYALLSCGENNYGHPSPSVLSALEERGISIYRTDVSGDVTFTTDGASLSVTTEK